MTLKKVINRKIRDFFDIWKHKTGSGFASVICCLIFNFNIKKKAPLLVFNSKGIYCKAAGVYLDPWKPVDKSIITHGQAGHSRCGHKNYIAHTSNVLIIKHRLGAISVCADDEIVQIQF